MKEIAPEMVKACPGTMETGFVRQMLDRVAKSQIHRSECKKKAQGKKQEKEEVDALVEATEKLSKPRPDGSSYKCNWKGDNPQTARLRDRSNAKQEKVFACNRGTMGRLIKE